MKYTKPDLLLEHGQAVSEKLTVARCVSAESRLHLQSLHLDQEARYDSRRDWCMTLSHHQTRLITAPRESEYPTSEDTSDNAHDMFLHAGVMLDPLHFLNAGTSCLWVGVLATDRGLRVPHASVEVDVLDWDPQWAVCRAGEPAVDLPNEVQEDEKRAGEVKLEEGRSVQIRAANWPQSHVELRDESEHADEHTAV